MSYHEVSEQLKRYEAEGLLEQIGIRIESEHESLFVQ